MTTLRQKLDQDPHFRVKNCEVLKRQFDSEVERGWVFVHACFEAKWEYDEEEGDYIWKEFTDLDNEIIDEELIYDLFESYNAPDGERMVLLDHRGEKSGHIVGCWPATVKVAEGMFNWNIKKGEGSGLVMCFKPDDPEPFHNGTIRTVSIGFEVYDDPEDE